MPGIKYFLITDFETMELMGVKGLFTRQRVDGESLPEGFSKYSIREGYEGRFSSMNRDMFANRVGDFVCKAKLDMDIEGEREIEEEYKLTHQPVDLDQFFGEDLKMKVAQELDAFVYDFDPYEYQDNASGATREEVVQSVRDGLDEKAYVEGSIRYFDGILKEDREEPFLPLEMRQSIRRYISVLTRINEGNRDELDRLINQANAIKEKPANGADGKLPDGRP